MKALVARFVREDSGQDLIEYGLLVGIITSGLRESLSTWKFITGAACFAFGGICAAVYAFSQGDSVPLDNSF